jgi:hypothetical protein
VWFMASITHYVRDSGSHRLPCSTLQDAIWKPDNQWLAKEKETIGHDG